MRSSQTLDDEHRLDSNAAAEPGTPEPGLVLIFSDGRPAFELLPLDRGALEVGRGEVAGVTIRDKRMSRAHARISLDGDTWTLQDLESRNGSAADGQDIPGSTKKVVRKLARTGGSLFLLAADLRPLRSGITRSGDAVMGPGLQRTFAAITSAARAGRILHITGESGSGKELAARAFHDAGPSSAGPFVAVNAATLKPELAEAMLFGVRKGFYSGAPGGPGFVQAASGGTLFLDEVAELDASVQAKLLRVFENREVTPLGATKPEPVDFRFCSATHADLRTMVANGKMRDDLYYRIATPAVALPPLRERLEEIPWFIERAVKDAESAAPGLGVHVSFVEACLLRIWPGNVRELVAEVKNAARAAGENGGVLLARHLHERAGTSGAPPPATTKTTSVAKAPPAAEEDKHSDEAIAAALRASGNNKAKAARLLGMHRNQLYRWMKSRGWGGDGDENDSG